MDTMLTRTRVHDQLRALSLKHAEKAVDGLCEEAAQRQSGYTEFLCRVLDEELARRLAAWTAPEPALSSGYWKLYIDHVLQADEGADLDFLVGRRGAFVPRDNH